MKLMYKFAKFPRNKKLLTHINLAALEVFDTLRIVDVNSLPISDYNKRYLLRYQNKLRTHLQRLTFLLAWGLDNTKKPLSETILIDYGGGSGLLTLLAKACGVGTVIYNDIYDVSCVDAEIVGKKLGFQADHYIAGNIDTLDEYLKTNSLVCDVLVSCDVLEHIYDLNEFFQSLHNLSEENFSYVISTHANPLNPIINRTLMKQQNRAELHDREADYGHKDRDSLLSFLKVRKDIITDNFSAQLNKHDIDQLASNTRGLKESDILAAGQNYIKTGKMPTAPSHPTNTCDPYTGNMADRLTSPFEIRDKMERAGFSSQVLSCYHGNPDNWAKNILAMKLDILINVLGNQGLRLASYFMLYGGKK